MFLVFIRSLRIIFHGQYPTSRNFFCYCLFCWYWVVVRVAASAAIMLYGMFSLEVMRSLSHRIMMGMI
uniref:Uncharacterized protein n=1 Tax=Rhizophora mucronata TaxID=61149 RepID=A0A2P2JX28_RHIMU